MAADAKDGSPAKKYSRPWWLAKLRAEEKAHKDFRRQAEKAQKDYRGDDTPEIANSTEDQSNFYPVFWSNVQGMKGYLLSKSPKPDVRKRNKDGQIPKSVPTAVERGLTFTLDTEDVDDHADRAMEDYLVAGLGAAKVEYEAEVGPVAVLDAMGQPVPVRDEFGIPQLDEEGQPRMMMTEDVIAQRMWLEYIPWPRFRWEPVKDWEDVTWVGVVHYMSRQEVRDRFDVDVKDADMASGEARMSDRNGEPREQAKYQGLVTVVEIWCKTTRKLHWIGLETPEIDVEEDDPLGLKGFFPFPRPMMLNIKSGQLIPKPDYTFVSPACKYVDKLTKRIYSLTNQIKAVYAHDGSMPELAQLADPTIPDGTIVGINGMHVKLQTPSGGRPSLDTIMLTRDNTAMVGVVQTLMQLRDVQIAKIDQITGYSDIQRGQTDPNETAAAQQIKGQWANVRLTDKKKAVNGFFREVFRIMAEVMSEHFTAQQFALMTGVQLSPEEMEILKSDIGRTFAIDVETDSTIAADDAEEKAQRLELSKTFMDYFNATSGPVAQGTMPPDMAKAIMSMAIGAYKYAADLDEAIDAMPSTAQKIAELQQQLQQSQQQLQQAQTELQKVDQAANAREDMKANADMIGKQGEAVKDASTARLNDARANEADAGAFERVANAIRPPEPKIVAMRPPGRPA